MEKLKHFLQAITPYSDEEFELHKDSFYELQVKKGDYLVKEGDVCKHIAFIIQGAFRTYYFNGKSEEVTACFRCKNEVLSSYKSFIQQSPSSIAIQALENSELIVIDYKQLQHLYNTSRTWLIIGRMIAEQEYINMEEYASVLNSEAPKGKYERLIKEQPEAIQKATVEQIASYLGVSRRTLSRIRSELSH